MARHKYLLLLYVFNLWCSVHGIEYSISSYSSEPKLKEGSACVVDHSGVKVNGICVSLDKCTTASRVYLNVEVDDGFDEEYSTTICSKGENGDLIVCCTDCTLDESENLKGRMLMENRNIYDKKATKAWTKCVEYFSKLPYHCCNNSNLYMPFWDDKRQCTHYNYGAHGGVNAQTNEFPHMALLGYGAEHKSAQWLCGGSIISERFILSAAHCSSVPELGNVTFAALGILKRTDLPDYWGVYKIKTIIKHPEYKSPSKYHDIMLLETENEINFGKSILPACLDSGKVSDYVLTATGWGRRSSSGELENHLQAIELHKYDDALCSRLFPPHRHFKNGYDNETQMCYGRVDKIVDTCEGDSGGPLQNGLSMDSISYILGITSFGKDCGIPGNAGMYTRVLYYVPWIESIVWTDDC